MDTGRSTEPPHLQQPSRAAACAVCRPAPLPPDDNNNLHVPTAINAQPNPELHIHRNRSKCHYRAIHPSPPIKHTAIYIKNKRYNRTHINYLFSPHKRLTLELLSWVTLPLRAAGDSGIGKEKQDLVPGFYNASHKAYSKLTHCCFFK